VEEARMPAKLALGEALLRFAAVSGDGAWSPPVDVREHPAEYTVVADLPGVEPTTVEVTADGDLLTITGARRDRLRAGGVPVRLERPTGKLRRALRLPGGCDGSKIRAQFHDGVLEIDVPKGLIAVQPAHTLEGDPASRLTVPVARPVDRRRDSVQRVAPGSHRREKTRRRAATGEALEAASLRGNPHGSTPSSRSWEGVDGSSPSEGFLRFLQLLRARPGRSAAADAL
jgi:HSP20 family protein